MLDILCWNCGFIENRTFQGCHVYTARCHSWRFDTISGRWHATCRDPIHSFNLMMSAETPHRNCRQLTWRWAMSISGGWSWNRIRKPYHLTVYITVSWKEYILFQFKQNKDLSNLGKAESLIEKYWQHFAILLKCISGKNRDEIRKWSPQILTS